MMMWAFRTSYIDGDGAQAHKRELTTVARKPAGSYCIYAAGAAMVFRQAST